MIPDLTTEELNALRALLNREINPTGGGVVSLEGKPKSESAVAPGTNFALAEVQIPVIRIIKLTSAATGGGYYNAKQYRLNTTIAISTTDLSTAKIEGGLLGSCIAVNFQEVAAGTNDLVDAGNTSQLYFFGIQIGRSGDYPLFALLGNAIWLEACP